MSYAEKRVKQPHVRVNELLQNVYSDLSYQLGDEVKAIRFYQAMSEKLRKTGMIEESNALLEISKNEETHRSILNEVMIRIRLKRAGVKEFG